MSSNGILRALQKALKLRVSAPGFDQNLSKVAIVSAGNGKCVAEIKIDECHCNINGALHGGMTATLVDIVSTLALVSKEGNTPGVSVDLSVTFIKAAKLGTEVVIKADTVKSGKNLAFLDVELSEKITGKILATGKQTKYVG